MYQWYFDDNPKRSLAEKLTGIIRLYTERYGTKPGIILTHPDQAIQRSDCLIVTGDSQGVVVRKDNFLAGLN